MTTGTSPLRQLKAQAEKISKTIKAFERGEMIDPRFAANLFEARTRESIKVGIGMDDKVISIELTWATIATKSEVRLAEFILKLMKRRH